jgi:hypothetical protein
MRTAILLAVLALAGCAAEPRYVQPSVGTGWSRAPDLSVYGAMDVAAEVAREQEMLCFGRDPAAVDAAWRAEFGARADWIAAAMVDRYGHEAVAQATAQPVGRVACPAIEDRRWRRSYARLLRTLELRLYPADYWSTL